MRMSRSLQVSSLLSSHANNRTEGKVTQLAGRSRLVHAASRTRKVYRPNTAWSISLLHTDVPAKHVRNTPHYVLTSVAIIKLES